MKGLVVLGTLLALLAFPLIVEAADATVEVGHNRLEPAEISIAAGAKVAFHNQDEMPGGHTIVADDGFFESPPLAKDDSWSRCTSSDDPRLLRLGIVGGIIVGYSSSRWRRD